MRWSDSRMRASTAYMYCMFVPPRLCLLLSLQAHGLYMAANLTMLPQCTWISPFHLSVMSGTIQPVVSYGREHCPTCMDMILETL
jgi:hypothetical protein